MAQRVDPLNNYNFQVEIDGIQVGGFSEASGLESTIETIEYREGGDNTHRSQAARQDDVHRHRAEARHDRRRQHALRVAPPDSCSGKVDRKSGSIIVLRPRRAGDAALQLRQRLADEVEPGGLQRHRQGGRDRRVHARPRRTGAGVMLQTEHDFTLPLGYIDKEGGLHKTGHHAAGHRGRRDPAAARRAGAGQPRLPHGHRPVAGRRAPRRRARTSTPARSRTSSPPTSSTCRTSTTRSTRSPSTPSSVACPRARSGWRWRREQRGESLAIPSAG